MQSVVLVLVLLSRTWANDDLCRLVELDVPSGLFSFDSNQQDLVFQNWRLFYKTDVVCQRKPVFRSVGHPFLYQFQAPNNRWWTLYDTTNSSYRLGIREWCDAWNAQPLLAMSLGSFQQPLGRTRRWQRVIVHENNNSYTYKPVSNVYLKCYHQSIPPICQTRKLVFLFDLTQSTTIAELRQMQLWAKTMAWLFYNETKIALTFYRDSLHTIQPFEKQASSKSLEHLFDSIDTMLERIPGQRRTSIPWEETIRMVITQIFKRRFLLPLSAYNLTRHTDDNNSTDEYDDVVFTDPYPPRNTELRPIDAFLNITIVSRKKRATTTTKNRTDNLSRVLVILTARSKSIYDYIERDVHLADFITSVPARIVVVDFNMRSNRKIAEYAHSAFIEKATHVLVSTPVAYNYIDTYEEEGDALHGTQLFDHHHRLCQQAEQSLSMINTSSKIIETTTTNLGCFLVTLTDGQEMNMTLKDQFEYTFYQTSEQCFSAPVYRSLSDRNLYAQRISDGRWIIVRVDPLLPSAMSIAEKLALTTTSTVPPEFFYANDLAMSEPMENETLPVINTPSSLDFPTSVPHCSDTPGMDIVWESESNRMTNEFFHWQTPRQWTSTTSSNQSDSLTSTCNKFQFSCTNYTLDLLVLVNVDQQYLSSIRTFLTVLLTLLEPSNHRISFVLLSSTSTDPFRYYLPLTSLTDVTIRSIQQMLLFDTNDDPSTNSFIIELNEHLERLSQYLTMSTDPNNNTKVILTISSRINFQIDKIKTILERYSTFRYMVLDPHLRTDDEKHDRREFFFRSLASSPSQLNLFWSYAANRDLTFSTVFRVLEALCGSL